MFETLRNCKGYELANNTMVELNQLKGFELLERVYYHSSEIADILEILYYEFEEVNADFLEKYENAEEVSIDETEMFEDYDLISRNLNELVKVFDDREIYRIGDYLEQMYSNKVLYPSLDNWTLCELVKY